LWCEAQNGDQKRGVRNGNVPFHKVPLIVSPNSVNIALKAMLTRS
jgi:hypothetical protein